MKTKLLIASIFALALVAVPSLTFAFRGGDDFGRRGVHHRFGFERFDDHRRFRFNNFRGFDDRGRHGGRGFDDRGRHGFDDRFHGFKFEHGVFGHR